MSNLRRFPVSSSVSSSVATDLQVGGTSCAALATGRTNGRTICFYAVIITTINSALNPCRGGYPSPRHKALQRANPHSCDVHADYSSSSLLSLADLLITFTLSCCARSTIALRFCAETLWATSAQYFLLCIKRRSRSATLWTTNLRKPLGSRCLVFLLDP